MDAAIVVIITIGGIIAIKWWWSYLSMWYRSVQGFKMMMKVGGPEFAKNININDIMKKALNKATGKYNEDEEVDEEDAMYQ